jgi:hypothetical protein
MGSIESVRAQSFVRRISLLSGSRRAILRTARRRALDVDVDELGGRIVSESIVFDKVQAFLKVYFELQIVKISSKTLILSYSTRARHLSFRTGSSATTLDASPLLRKAK